MAKTKKARKAGKAAAKKTAVANYRPPVITAICVICFVVLLAGLAGLASNIATAAKMRNFNIEIQGVKMGIYMSMGFLVSALFAAGLAGIWKMSKWGVWAYTGAAALNLAAGIYVATQMLRISMPGVNVGTVILAGVIGIVIQAVIITIFIRNLDRMS